VDPYRLPRSVVPSRYDIRLEPDLTTLTFRGEETIAVRVDESVSEIVVNAVELAVDEASAPPSRSTRRPSAADSRSPSRSPAAPAPCGSSSGAR
jgi:puromycin-sensitive aminopeptidase